jgi:hypothetical protein
MAIDCLRRVAERKLPCVVYDLREIDNLRVLRAAGMVMAFLPPPDYLPHGESSQKPAQVLAITKKGRDALKRRVAV